MSGNFFFYWSIRLQQIKKIGIVGCSILKIIIMKDHDHFYLDNFINDHVGLASLFTDSTDAQDMQLGGRSG